MKFLMITLMFIFQAMSTSSMMLGSVSNVSMMPSSSMLSSIQNNSSTMTSYYKSLPALDKHFDQLDRELQQLSDSVDVLYQQEDSEINFLDSFIDYDDISVHNGITGSRSKAKQGLPPIIPSENVYSRKDKIRDGLKWLSYKSKLSLRQFGSRDNLKTKEESKQTSKKLDLSVVRSYRDIPHCRT